jgi:peroxiredoxin
LERRSAELRERDAAIVAVGPGSHAAADRVTRLLGVSFPVFGDPRLEVFSLFGYRRVLAVVRQSGTIVVDRGGTIVMLHRTANPFDALPFDDVLAALDRAASPSSDADSA